MAQKAVSTVELTKPTPISSKLSTQIPPGTQVAFVNHPLANDKKTVVRKTLMTAKTYADANMILSKQFLTPLFGEVLDVISMVTFDFKDEKNLAGLIGRHANLHRKAHEEKPTKEQLEELRTQKADILRKLGAGNEEDQANMEAFFSETNACFLGQSIDHKIGSHKYVILLADFFRVESAVGLANAYFIADEPSGMGAAGAVFNTGFDFISGKGTIIGKMENLMDFEKPYTDTWKDRNLQYNIYAGEINLGNIVESSNQKLQDYDKYYYCKAVSERVLFKILEDAQQDRQYTDDELSAATKVFKKWCEEHGPDFELHARVELLALQKQLVSEVSKSGIVLAQQKDARGIFDFSRVQEQSNFDMLEKRQKAVNNMANIFEKNPEGDVYYDYACKILKSHGNFPPDVKNLEGGLLSDYTKLVLNFHRMLPIRDHKQHLGDKFASMLMSCRNAVVDVMKDDVTKITEKSIKNSCKALAKNPCIDLLKASLKSFKLRQNIEIDKLEFCTFLYQLVERKVVEYDFHLKNMWKCEQKLLSDIQEDFTPENFAAAAGAIKPEYINYLASTYDLKLPSITTTEQNHEIKVLDSDVLHWAFPLVLMKIINHALKVGALHSEKFIRDVSEQILGALIWNDNEKTMCALSRINVFAQNPRGESGSWEPKQLLSFHLIRSNETITPLLFKIQEPQQEIRIKSQQRDQQDNPIDLRWDGGRVTMQGVLSQEEKTQNAVVISYFNYVKNRIGGSVKVVHAEPADVEDGLGAQREELGAQNEILETLKKLLASQNQILSMKKKSANDREEHEKKIAENLDSAKDNDDDTSDDNSVDNEKESEMLLINASVKNLNNNVCRFVIPLIILIFIVLLVTFLHQLCKS